MPMFDQKTAQKEQSREIIPKQEFIAQAVLVSEIKEGGTITKNK